MIGPEAGDLSEFRVCAAGCQELRLEGGLLLDEGPMLRLERLFLLDALPVQNGQTELQIADLAVIALALLLKTGILCTNFLQFLHLSGLFRFLEQVFLLFGGIFVMGMLMVVVLLLC